MIHRPIHPEDGLLAIRKELGLFANLRPTCYPSLAGNTNFKAGVLDELIYFRPQLTGGLYFGQPKRWTERTAGGRLIQCSTLSTKSRIVRVGFEMARTRKKLISVDKANVCSHQDCGDRWRSKFQGIS